VERYLQQVPHLTTLSAPDLAAPAQNAVIAVLQTVECAATGSTTGRRCRRAVLGCL